MNTFLKLTKGQFVTEETITREIPTNFSEVRKTVQWYAKNTKIGTVVSDLRSEHIKRIINRLIEWENDYKITNIPTSTWIVILGKELEYRRLESIYLQHDKEMDKLLTKMHQILY